MKKILVFDENGNYREDKIVEDGYEPNEYEYLTEIDAIFSFYQPILADGEVVEGLTQEEIEELQNVPQEPSDVELLKNSDTFMLMELMNTQARLQQAEKLNADLTLQLVMKGVI